MSEIARQALEEARENLGRGSYATALELCARARAHLTPDGPPELRGLEVWLRTCAEVEREPEASQLDRAADGLAENADWEDAMGAYEVLATLAVRRGDIKEGRRRLAQAIGCGQAGGSRITAPSLQRRLAQLELEAGKPERAVVHASLALERLEGVLLLAARRVEAECVETLGDAHAALGDRTSAAACWRDAIERQERLDRHQAADKIRKKL
jgi:tetratricopeptide (TPR) repeat protein